MPYRYFSQFSACKNISFESPPTKFMRNHQNHEIELGEPLFHPQAPSHCRHRSRFDPPTYHHPFFSSPTLGIAGTRPFLWMTDSPLSQLHSVSRLYAAAPIGINYFAPIQLVAQCRGLVSHPRTNLPMENPNCRSGDWRGHHSMMDSKKRQRCLTYAVDPHKMPRYDSRGDYRDSSTPESSHSGDSHTTDRSEHLRSIVNQLRQWEHTNLGLRHLQNPQQGMQFSVMSYNVLAQSLLQENSELYQYCPRTDLDWETRKERMMYEFTHTNADVLCLQEVQNDHFDNFFNPKLTELGYKGMYKKRTGNKTDGCAIFYKDAMFTLVKWIAVEYFRPGIYILDRDNIAMVAMLKAKNGSSKKVCVANTHLLFNPHRGDIKLAQLRILMAETDRFAFRRVSPVTNRPVYYPVIMCGDMNSLPHCPLYKLISTGSLDYNRLISRDVSGQSLKQKGLFYLPKELVPSVLGISDQCQYVDTVKQRSGRSQDSDGAEEEECTTNHHVPPQAGGPSGPLFSSGQMSHQLNLVSAYDHQLKRLGGLPAVTTYHCNSCSNVDYIFYSVLKKRSYVRYDRVVLADVREGSLQLLSTYGLMSGNELWNLGGLPNAAQPSDHIPLVAKFLLAPNVCDQ